MSCQTTRIGRSFAGRSRRRANPAVQLVELIAALEETDPVDLPTMYDCVDGMLDDLFSKPPSDEAQLTVEFSYHAYRITVEQDGVAKFVKID